MVLIINKPANNKKLLITIEIISIIIPVNNNNDTICQSIIEIVDS